MPTPTAVRALALLLALVAPFRPLRAQSGAPPATPPPAPWYTTFRIRGYGQIRYNRLFESNSAFQCEQCDRSWGDDGGFFIRRARLIVQGQLHPQVAIYLQPDFASTAGTTLNVGQMRDWYVDVGLNHDNSVRVRLGQSKIPYSFESLQSSQQRLPLDRADATNSAQVNERDLGAFVMWAPATVRERFAALVNDGLKGSGDYGVVAVGLYNGQGANRADANDRQTAVARISYPFVRGRQIIEPGVAAYTGVHTITADQRTTGVKGRADWTYRDERVLVSLNIAPRPFGVLAEYNIGRGPEYVPQRDSIATRRLHGGFITTSYRRAARGQVFIPFARYQVYDGGKKHERDARRHMVRDVEAGLEWQPNPAFELVAEWYRGTRRFEDKQRPDNLQRGHLLRLQAQFNY